MSRPDPQTEIFLHLMRTRPKKGRTVRAIATAIERSPSTVQANLNFMADSSRFLFRGPWVEVESEDGVRPKVWRLTEYGREVARYRAATNRRNHA